MVSPETRTLAQHAFGAAKIYICTATYMPAIATLDATIALSSLTFFALQLVSGYSYYLSYCVTFCSMLVYQLLVSVYCIYHKP